MGIYSLNIILMLYKSLNLIETLWRKMKHTWLKPKNYISKEILHSGVNNILKNYNKGEYKIDFTVKLKCYDNFV